MGTTNIKLAIRNIIKNKTESFISILGMGIGLGCIMLLIILSIHEHSFDRFIPNHKNVFRVLMDDNCSTPYQLGPTVTQDIPGISSYFRFFQTGEVFMQSETNEKITESYFGFSDPGIFESLGIDMIYGKPAMHDNEMAISESIAKKYFNRENVVGEIMRIKLNDDFVEITISGVYHDFPSNSTLSPNFVASIDFSRVVLNTSKKILGDYSPDLEEYRSWKNNYFYTYIFLNQATNPDIVLEEMQRYTSQLDPEKWKDTKFGLQPVADIYYNSSQLTGNSFSKTGNKSDLKYYLAIALAILFIAIINYVFLTRAKIVARLTEMGAKKALGATKKNILGQVFFESNLISILSVIPAIFVIITGIPFINSTIGKEVGTEVFSLWQTWFVIVLVVLITGSFSGYFIGNSVSRVSPVLLLSGLTSSKKSKNTWSNSFLSIHFTVFIILIVSVMTFKKQFSYSLTNFKNVNPDNVLICDLNTPELQKHFSFLKDQISKNPDVLKVAGSSLIPPTNFFLPIKLKLNEEVIAFDGLIMEEGMIELLEMQMIDGESFGDYQKNVLIINESVSKKYEVKAGDLLNGIYVKGVVKDFMAHTLREPIKPMVILQQHPEKMRVLAIKTSGRNLENIKTDVHKYFKEVSPDANMNVNLFKDQINQFYSTENNQAKLIGAFSILAMVLAIMGLFGIVWVSISKRIKEIGIRKVNGAKVLEVLNMLNVDFIKWGMLAISISIPVSWYIMTRWLENFAFKTDLSWWVFALAGILALCIALLTVSWQAWRAASRNPVEALRNE